MGPCPPCYIRVRAILRVCYIRVTPLYLDGLGDEGVVFLTGGGSGNEARRASSPREGDPPLPPNSRPTPSPQALAYERFSKDRLRASASAGEEG